MKKRLIVVKVKEKHDILLLETKAVCEIVSPLKISARTVRRIFENKEKIIAEYNNGNSNKLLIIYRNIFFK